VTAAVAFGGSVRIDTSPWPALYLALDVTPTGEAVAVWTQDDDIWSSVLR
jgi:hypothetical protein